MGFVCVKKHKRLNKNVLYIKIFGEIRHCYYFYTDFTSSHDSTTASILSSTSAQAHLLQQRRSKSLNFLKLHHWHISPEPIWAFLKKYIFYIQTRALTASLFQTTKAELGMLVYLFVFKEYIWTLHWVASSFLIRLGD